VPPRPCRQKKFLLARGCVVLDQPQLLKSSVPLFLNTAAFLEITADQVLRFYKSVTIVSRPLPNLAINAFSQRMKKSASRKPPRFFWQGVLILLPISLLALFGFAAIVRDRKAVEEDARQRAVEILSQINAGLARDVASRLGVTAVFVREGMNASFLRERRAEEEESRRRAVESLSQTNPGLARDVASRLGVTSLVVRGGTSAPITESTNVSDIKIDALVLPAGKRLDPRFHDSEIAFDDDGNLLSPTPYENPPKPPAWLEALSDSQREPWTKYSQIIYSSSDLAQIKSSFDAFIESGPSADARANAQFMLLRAQLGNVGPADSFDQWLNFAGQCSNELTEAGLPLSSIAFANAIHFSRNGNDAERIFNQLTAQILKHPSVITPQLLARAEQLLPGQVQSLETLARWREIHEVVQKTWEKDERRRDLASLLPRSAKVGGNGTTTFWMQSDQETFFCLIRPRLEVGGEDGKPDLKKRDRITSVRFFQKDVVRRAFEDSIGDKHIVLPDYFSLAVELEGEPLRLNVNSATNFSAPSLAQISDRMMLPPISGSEIKFTPGPGSIFTQPAFTLRMHLASRELLFARQHQRSVLFGALVAFSVVAALVGFVQARRAFLRQLRLNEMKSNFVSSVSHELRAPIASVRLLAEGLERGKISEPKKQNEYFKFIVQECRRLSSLIENVLDFSRIEQGRKEYEFEPTDIVKLVEETVKLMEPYAAEKNVKLIQSLDSPQLSAENLQPSLDGHAIQQALVNLIDNAIKHSPNEATVTVGLTANVLPRSSLQIGGADAMTLEGPPDVEIPAPELPGESRQHIQIYVEDSGPGIQSGEQEKIFERFYRLGSELRRETQGVGIGLSIVQHIVEAHGGKVQVQSEVGKGSRFTMELGSTCLRRVRGEQDGKLEIEP